jgi:hypothetical protein
VVAAAWGCGRNRVGVGEMTELKYIIWVKLSGRWEETWWTNPDDSAGDERSSPLPVSREEAERYLNFARRLYIGSAYAIHPQGFDPN